MRSFCCTPNARKDMDTMPTEYDAESLWRAIVEREGQRFCTTKGLEFTYAVRGNEMFVSRKDTSITRATVNVAFQRALALLARGEAVAGPKKLGTFGASYLHPIFIALGVMDGGGDPCRAEQMRLL